MNGRLSRVMLSEASVRRAFVTLAVMVVIMLISYASYQFVAEAVAEHKNAAAYADRVQLELCADSAEQFLLVRLGQRRALAGYSRSSTPGVGRRPESTADRYANVAVGGDVASRRQTRFTLIGRALGPGGDERLQYGPTNESAKLSLSALPEWERRRPGSGLKSLASLPGVETELAHKILAFLRGDQGTYAAAAPWHGIALEELLQVREVSHELLFGMDRNRNGFVGDRELSGVAGVGAAAGGSLAPGGTREAESGEGVPLASFLTPYSAERNVNRRGAPRINVNLPNLSQLRAALAARVPAPWVEFIVAYRQFGPAGGTPLASPANAIGRVPAGALHPIASLYDLIGARTAVVRADGKVEALASPFAADRAAYRDYLLQLTDELTVDPRAVIPGRVNVDLAPVEVLRAIPGIDDPLVERITTARQQRGEGTTHEERPASWLVVEGWIEPVWMRELEPYITSGGDVYRVQTVSFFAPGDEADAPMESAAAEPFVRREIVLDASRSSPRVVARQDLTNLGRGYALEALAP